MSGGSNDREFDFRKQSHHSNVCMIVLEHFHESGFAVIDMLLQLSNSNR